MNEWVCVCWDGVKRTESVTSNHVVGILDYYIRSKKLGYF